MLLLRQAQILCKCLDHFCSHSGQRVSLNKSKLFLSPNISHSLASGISNILGIPLTNNLGKYLGVPIIHGRVTKQTYSEVLEKVQSRLSGWKAKNLSLAGRVTLKNSVTSSLPLYTMKSTKLPLAIFDNIDKLNRQFLWGGSNEKHKIHLVKWDVVTNPRKKDGGLNIKEARILNQAMLAKLGWKMMSDPETLWVRVFKNKYLKNSSFLDVAIKPNASYVWKSIASTRDIIRELGELGMEQMFNFGLIAGCLGDLCAIELIMEPFLNNQTLVKDFFY